MSVKLSAYVWDGCAAAGIKGNKLLIMLRLADYASDEGIAYPSVATIARQLGAGRSTVITLIGELVKDGWLTKKNVAWPAQHQQPLHPERYQASSGCK